MTGEPPIRPTLLAGSPQRARSIRADQEFIKKQLAAFGRSIFVHGSKTAPQPKL
jgi:hypothetical protein